MADPKETVAERSVRLEILERLSELTAAGLAFVAALAWNDAVQSLFHAIFGEASSIVAKFFYAVIITLIVVLVTRMLTRMRMRVIKK